MCAITLVNVSVGILVCNCLDEIGRDGWFCLGALAFDIGECSTISLEFYSRLPFNFISGEEPSKLDYWNLMKFSLCYLMHPNQYRKLARNDEYLI